MKYKKIIFLHPYFLTPGGAGNFVLETANGLIKKGFDILILTIKVKKDIKKLYPALKFIELMGPITNSWAFWINYIIFQRKLNQELDKYKNMVIHPHVFPANWWAFIYKFKNRKVKCVWFCHEPSAFIHSKRWINSIPSISKKITLKAFQPILRVIDVFLVNKYADIIISNSKFSSTLVKKAYNEKSDYIVYPAVNSIHFKPSKNKKNYLFVISKLSKFKNIDFIIKSFKRFNETNKDYYLYIGGEGEYKHELIKLVKKLKLKEKIKFLGKIPYNKLPKYYSESKLLLFASKHEPFGMVPIEAMSCGTPVLAIDSGGLKETVIDGVTGRLIKDYSEKEYSSCMKEILEMEQQQYNNLCISCVKHSKKFSWEGSINKLSEIFVNL